MSGIIGILLSEAYWTSGIFHRWMEGRGRRAFRNCSIKSLDGNFRSEAEALSAAEKAIEAKMISGVHWDSAKPTVSFCIPHETEKKIGELMNATIADSFDIARTLEIELKDLHIKDSARTREHNILVQENRRLLEQNNEARNLLVTRVEASRLDECITENLALKEEISELSESLGRCSVAWGSNRDVPRHCWEYVQNLYKNLQQKTARQ